MVSKLAQAHVEIILSTVLFVGFLIFVFIFLNYSFKTSQDISTEKIENKILESISTDLGKLLVVVDDADEDCYSLDEVQEEYGEIFVEVHDLINPRRYTIYYGDFFDQGDIGDISCSGKTGRDFAFGVYANEEIIVSQKIKDFKTAYEADYENLRQSLVIGDFSFQFKNLDGVILPKLSIVEKIPESVDVVSIDFPVRVVDVGGVEEDPIVFQELILNIRAWR